MAFFSPVRRYLAAFWLAVAALVVGPAHEAWAKRVAEDHSYSVTFEALGEADGDFGSPSQLALFRRATP